MQEDGLSREATDVRGEQNLPERRSTGEDGAEVAQTPDAPAPDPSPFGTVGTRLVGTAQD